MILVTGASGFVGQALCAHLMSRGKSVRAVVRDKSAATLRFVGNSEMCTVGNICTTTDWSMALESVHCVIHCAARAHIMRDESVEPLTEYRKVNRDATLALAQSAAEAGVRRFVCLSSVKVNGEQTDCVGSAESRVLSAEKGQNSSECRVLSAENLVAFREDDAPDPQDAYAISKWEAEQGLMALARETGMEVVFIRPPLVYGPGVKANFLSMMRWLDKGVPLPFGAIHNKRSLVALDNLVDLIVTCLEHPRAANQVFLVSDGEDLSTTELLRRTAAALVKPARLIPVPQRLLESGLRLLGKGDLAQRLCGSLQVDISKARDLLGWTPPVSVDEGLRRAAAGFRT